MNQVTVLIPVGKGPYKSWLPEAIDSAINQSVPPGEILLVDDAAGITDQDMHNWFGKYPEPLRFHSGYLVFNKLVWWWEGAPPEREIWISLWRLPHKIGFSQAFNCGMEVAIFDNIMYLAADDILGVDAIKDSLAAWETNHEKDGWYSLTYESPSGGICDIPINAAMITRNLWRWMGGYPPEAFAGPDALALSRLMVHAPDRIIKVAPGKVNYHIREHPQQETKTVAQPYSEEMTSIRNKATAAFKPNVEFMLK